MVSFTISALSAAALLSAASAAPAPTGTVNTTTKVQKAAGATHTVAVGRAGQLRFDPENVVAEIGDIVEFHYLPRNHSVAQSSFENPCMPQDASSFFSGFNFAVSEGQSKDVFQIEIKDHKPIWYYCSQPNGLHCKNGMTGVINQNFDGQKTLAAHKALAAKVQAPVQPAVVQGGKIIPNPNPLGGI